MAFQPDQIKKQHVLQAAERIENERLHLNPSTGYDVIINGKTYPPKEIIRQAHLFATYEESGIIYGGDKVNRILTSLGFKVISKIKYWKLGCNWASGQPSYFEILQQSKAVITVPQFKYKSGDIVLITEGFTVYALGKLLNDPEPLFNQPQLQKALISKGVPDESWVLVADVEWYDLTDSQIFKYKLQPGIRQVRKQTVIDNVLDVWENRDMSLKEIIFYVREYTERSDTNWQYPCMILIRRAWNDFGYETCYELNFAKDSGDRESLGEVKILQIEKKNTELPEHFTQLSDNFCSLGQTLNYYHSIRSNFPSEFMLIGKALRDCVFYPEFRKNFEDLEGFQHSLLRSSEAQSALYEALDNTQRGVHTQLRSFEFEFEYLVPHAELPHKIDFSFNKNPNLPNRFFCLIGKNGTGKTQILSQLAKKLSNVNETGKFIPERPVFTKIIAVSFSLFDQFEQPKRGDISYELISFKDKKGLLDEEDITQILWRAYGTILKSRTRKAIWLNCIRIALDLEFLSEQVLKLEQLANKEDFIETIDKGFSSGQKIIFHFITRLALILERNSILIFDEPETHLHPNITAKLIRSLDYILENFSSYCILATHSPLIVQDIPSQFIRIIERKGNLPVIRQPSIEVFGENLTNINNNIFYVDQEPALYKTILTNLLKIHSIEEIDSMFEGQLSLNARIYLETVAKNQL